MSFEHPPEMIARVPESVRDLLHEVAPRRLALTLNLLDQRLPQVIACAEAVNRRHNTSAILRSAEAFGVRAEEDSPLLESPTLRPHEEVQRLRRQLLAVFWRLLGAIRYRVRFS